MKTSKRKFKIISLICVLTAILISCEDRVQVDIEEKSKVLVVDAFLNNLRQHQKIRLTYTDNYFSGKKPPALSGANVTLTDLTNNSTHTFIDNGSGDYIFNLGTNDTIIYPGHRYELNIKYQGYQYKSISNCIKASSVDSLYFEYKEATDVLGSTTKAGYRLRLIAQDLIGPESDFYWIKIYKNGNFYNRPENIQLEFFGYNNEYDGQLFFTDKWATSGPDGAVDPCVTGDKARLEIHGISRETYDFLNIGQRMSANSGLFATTPINLPTNIMQLDKNSPKVIGQFSISDVKYSELICP